MTRAVDVAWGVLKRRNVVAECKYGDWVLLSASTAAIMQIHRSAPHLLSPLSNSVIRIMCK